MVGSSGVVVWINHQRLLSITKASSNLLSEMNISELPKQEDNSFKFSSTAESLWNPRMIDFSLKKGSAVGLKGLVSSTADSSDNEFHTEGEKEVMRYAVVVEEGRRGLMTLAQWIKVFEVEKGWAGM